jgi:membrane protease YdiL (CAAX protease family)
LEKYGILKIIENIFLLGNMKNKDFFITLLFIVILLGVYEIFPAKGVFQQTIIRSSFFIIIPVIFNKIVLKRKLSDFGLEIGNWKQGFIWSVVSSLVLIIIFSIMIYFFDFLKQYKVPVNIMHDYGRFVFYELTSTFFMVFIFEFFFRGFILFFMEAKMKIWAIVFQALIFGILVITVGYSTWNLLPYLIFAPLGGLIAYKSRSIIYSGALQLIMLIILDATLVHIIK